ncbi:MAG: hypothetical protein ACE5JR_08055 [Gemmatimonadota bacterium]
MNGVTPLLVSLAAALSAAGCGEGAESPRGSAPARGSVTAPDTALRNLAAEILPAIERVSGLPARGPLRLGLRSKADLERYLSSELDRQLPPEKASALVRVYARLGLVPDTIRLDNLLRSLLLEQVVGYYDPKADTLFVVEGVDPAQLEVVLAHEMVHALQDQYMDLDSLMTSLEEDNDRSTAARAALEGHATFAMLEWFLGKSTGQPVDLTAFPNLAEILSGNPAAFAVDMPVLQQVPALIRESLLFPYVGGLGFLQGYWTAFPDRPIPLGAALPESTEQIIHPDRSAGPRRDAPVRVEFAEAPAAEWREVYADGLGELETRIFLAEHLREETRARQGAAGWDGDRYRLLDSPAGEVLVWATAWDDAVEASEFEAAVRRAYGTRYGGPSSERRVMVERKAIDGIPVVLVLDLPAALDAQAAAGAARFTIRGG